MGEHHFGVGRGRIKASVAKRIDAIAQRHGADFVWANVPGQGPSYWFSCPNFGAPHDGQRARAVWKALDDAGLATGAGLADTCFVPRRHAA